MGRLSLAGPWMVAAEAHWPGRLPHNELWGKPDRLGESLFRVLNAFDKNFGGGPAHDMQRLSDSGKSWAGVGSDEDVVEADHGDVIRAGEPGIFDSPNGSDRSGVVEAEDRRKVAGAF